MQQRRNSIANALELRLSYINTSIFDIAVKLALCLQSHQATAYSDSACNCTVITSTNTLRHTLSYLAHS